mgnify:CR=1 FL=1
MLNRLECTRHIIFVVFIVNMNELESHLGDGLGQAQTLIAWSVVFAHVIGGASLLLGFITRLAAAANAVVLFGAVVISSMNAAMVVWRGSGPLSLDHLMRLDVEGEAEIGCALT